jgi:hypothetical protein
MLVASHEETKKIMRHILPLLMVACAIATCATVSAQIKAQSYDTPSYVQFSEPRYEVSKTETNAILTLVRTGDYRNPASVDFSTHEGTAADNVDFKPCGGTIVFSGGQSIRTITVPILHSPDPVSKTFQVELAGGDPATIVMTPTVEVEIKAPAPSLNIALQPGGLLISWPDSATAFVLEQQIDGAWSPVTTTATLDQGVWSVTIDAPAAIAWFRLRSPQAP